MLKTYHHAKFKHATPNWSSVSHLTQTFCRHVCNVDGRK